jgi:hypothetical protein
VRYHQIVNEKEAEGDLDLDILKAIDETVQAITLDTPGTQFDPQPNDSEAILIRFLPVVETPPK